MGGMDIAATQQGYRAGRVSDRGEARKRDEKREERYILRVRTSLVPTGSRVRPRHRHTNNFGDFAKSFRWASSLELN